MAATKNDAEAFAFDPGDMPKMRKTPEVVKLIPEKSSEAEPKYPTVEAESLLSINFFDKQRNVMPKRLEELSRKIEDGRFHINVICIAHLKFDYEGYKQLLMNGQHTAHAVITTKKPVWSVRIEYTVDNLRQLCCLWAQFDPPGGARTPQQIANAFVEVLGDRKWSKQSINKCSSAVAVVHKGSFSYGANTTVDERIQMLMSKEYINHANFARNIVFGKGEAEDVRFLSRIATLAALVKTHQVNQKEASFFWTRVRDGGEVSASHPALVLRDLLQSSAFGNTKGVGKKRLTSHEAYIRCAQAWIAHRSGIVKDFKFSKTLPDSVPDFDTQTAEVA